MASLVMASPAVWGCLSHAWIAGNGTPCMSGSQTAQVSCPRATRKGPSSRG